MKSESLTPMSLWSRLLGWFNRPPARDRILSVLLEADDGSAVPGQTIGQRASVGTARLYPALAHLEEDGLVSHTEGLPANVRGGLPRFYYSLTEQGREVAHAGADRQSKIKRAS